MLLVYPKCPNPMANEAHSKSGTPQSGTSFRALPHSERKTAVIESQVSRAMTRGND
jgi:hypothetical protein